MKRLAACVAIVVCLATVPASASDWNVANGLWSNNGSWSPAVVPDGTNASIGNGGTATLQSVVPNITTFDLTGGSDWDISGAANLTTTGDAIIASGAFDDGYVSHSGGTLSLGADLILANGADSYAEWTMSNGSIGVTTDMAIGNGGDVVFDMSDGGLTVGGNVDIATSASGSGLMTVGGGTVTQSGSAFTVGGDGTLQVKGSTPMINVTNYEQASAGALNLVLDDNGIATINASGNVALNGELNVSIAGGASPTPGIYDIVAAGGTLTGQFSSNTLPAGVKLWYDHDSEAAQLYVGMDPPGEIIDQDADFGATVRDDSDNTVDGTNSLYMNETTWADGAGAALLWDLSSLSGIVNGDATLTARVIAIGAPSTFGVYEIYDDNADWATPGERIDYWNRDQDVDLNPSNYGNGEPWLDDTGAPVGTYRGAFNDAAPIDTLDNTGVSAGDDVTWTIPAAVIQSWIDDPAGNAGLMLSKTVDVGAHFYLSGITNPSNPAPSLSFELGAAAEPVVPEPAGLGLVAISLLAVKKRRR